MHKLTTTAVLMAALAASGCSTVEKVMPGKKIDYKEARSEPTLEIPPDLSSNAIEDSMVVPSATYSEYEDAASRRKTDTGGDRVLPTGDGVQLVRDGAQQWLVVQGNPTAVWNKVYDFWIQNGFLLTLENPEIGIMETDWAENRANITDGPIRKFLGKALDSLYSSGTRDKFRVRLERGNAGVTEIYLTHRGLEEVSTGYDGEDVVWQPRPSDPELEMEMLKRLMVHLGVQEERAQQMLAKKAQAQPRAQLVKGADASFLKLDDDFSRGWRRTGIALDRLSFMVQDRDRSQGIYYVRYVDPLKQKKKGFLSGIKFWDDGEAEDGDRYQIRLLAAGDHTRVEIYTADGQPDNSATAQRILTLLQEQLR